MEDPDPVTVAGLKVAVTPGGSPLTFNFTVPENPAWAAIVIVYCVPAPGCTD